MSIETPRAAYRAAFRKLCAPMSAGTPTSLNKKGQSVHVSSPWGRLKRRSAATPPSLGSNPSGVSSGYTAAAVAGKVYEVRRFIAHSQVC